MNFTDSLRQRAPSPVPCMKQKEIGEKSPQNLDVKELIAKILKRKAVPRWVAPRTLQFQVSKIGNVNAREKGSVLGVLFHYGNKSAEHSRFFFSSSPAKLFGDGLRQSGAVTSASKRRSILPSRWNVLEWRRCRRPNVGYFDFVIRSASGSAHSAQYDRREEHR